MTAPTGSSGRRFSAKASAAHDGSSTHCASSISTSSGACSLAAASAARVAPPTVSWPWPDPQPIASASTCACGLGHLDLQRTERLHQTLPDRSTPSSASDSDPVRRITVPVGLRGHPIEQAWSCRCPHRRAVES